MFFSRGFLSPYFLFFVWINGVWSIGLGFRFMTDSFFNIFDRFFDFGLLFFFGFCNVCFIIYYKIKKVDVNEV